MLWRMPSSSSFLTRLMSAAFGRSLNHSSPVSWWFRFEWSRSHFSGSCLVFCLLAANVGRSTRKLAASCWIDIVFKGAVIVHSRQAERTRQSAINTHRKIELQYVYLGDRRRLA